MQNGDLKSNWATEKRDRNGEFGSANDRLREHVATNSFWSNAGACFEKFTSTKQPVDTWLRTAGLEQAVRSSATSYLFLTDKLISPALSENAEESDTAYCETDLPLQQLMQETQLAANVMQADLH